MKFHFLPQMENNATALENHCWQDCIGNQPVYHKNYTEHINMFLELNLDS